MRPKFWSGGDAGPPPPPPTAGAVWGPFRSSGGSVEPKRIDRNRRSPCWATPFDTTVTTLPPILPQSEISQPSAPRSRPCRRHRFAGGHCGQFDPGPTEPGQGERLPEGLHPGAATWSTVTDAGGRSPLSTCWPGGDRPRCSPWAEPTGNTGEIEFALMTLRFQGSRPDSPW